jgi:hypothetical protein
MEKNISWNNTFQNNSLFFECDLNKTQVYFTIIFFFLYCKYLILQKACIDLIATNISFNNLDNKDADKNFELFKINNLLIMKSNFISLEQIKVII